MNKTTPLEDVYKEKSYTITIPLKGSVSMCGNEKAVDYILECVRRMDMRQEYQENMAMGMSKKERGSNE